jgi:hypothetical protein
MTERTFLWSWASVRSAHLRFASAEALTTNLFKQALSEAKGVVKGEISHGEEEI